MDNGSLTPNSNDNQNTDPSTNPVTEPAADAATSATPISSNPTSATETISTFSATETIAPQSMVTQAPKKKLPTQTILLAAFSAVCLIVAIVFGILYATGQNSNQKSNATTAHTTTPQTTIDIDEEDEESIAEDSTKEDKDTTNSTTDKTTTNTTAETATEVGVYIKDNYLYVPEWKVKFLLDDTLTEYGYSVIQNSISNSYGNYIVGLTAIQKSDVDSSPQAPYYDTINSCAMATVSRTLSTNPSLKNLVGPAKITDLNGFSYVVYDYSGKSYCSFSESYPNFNSVLQKIISILSRPETY